MVASYLLSAFAAFLLASSANLETFFVYALIYGLATGAWGQTSAWAADVGPKERMGTVMGANRMMGDLGFVIGPLALGYLAGQRTGAYVEPYPFYVTALIVLITGIMLVFARDPAKAKLR